MMLIIVHICVHFLTKILSKYAVTYKKSQSWQDLWKTVKWQLGNNNKAVFIIIFGSKREEEDTFSKTNTLLHVRFALARRYVVKSPFNVASPFHTLRNYHSLTVSRIIR